MNKKLAVLAATSSEKDLSQRNVPTDFSLFRLPAKDLTASGVSSSSGLKWEGRWVNRFSHPGALFSPVLFRARLPTYRKDRRIRTGECTSILGFGSYLPNFLYKTRARTLALVLAGSLESA